MLPKTKIERGGTNGQLSVKLSVKVVKELNEVLAELRWIVLEKKRVQNIFTLAEFSGLSDSGPRLQFFPLGRKRVTRAGRATVSESASELRPG
jgi:hypothetical protein